MSSQKNPLAPSMRQDSLHRLSPAFSVFLCFGTPVKPQAPNIGKSNSHVHKIVKDVLHPLSTSWKRCYFPGLDHFDHLGLVSLVHPRHKTDQMTRGFWGTSPPTQTGLRRGPQVDPECEKPLVMTDPNPPPQCCEWE